MRTLAPLAIALLLLTGCTSPSLPNEVDAARLDALATEPLLVGGTEEEATTSGRANVSINHDWSFAGDTAATLEQTRELLAEMRADGWIATLEACNASVEASLISSQFVAIKEFDDFTAAMLVQTNVDGAELDAFAPFHDEDPNPWHPTEELLGGCLDGVPPTSPVLIDIPTDLGEH